MRLKEYTKEEILAGELVYINLNWRETYEVEKAEIVKATEKQCIVKRDRYEYRVRYVDVGLESYGKFYCLKEDVPALVKMYQDNKIMILNTKIQRLEEEKAEILNLKENV